MRNHHNTTTIPTTGDHVIYVGSVEAFKGGVFEVVDMDYRVFTRVYTLSNGKVTLTGARTSSLIVLEDVPL